MSWIKNNEWLKPDDDIRIRWHHLGRFLDQYRSFRGRLLLALVLALAGSSTALLLPLLFWRLQSAIAFSDVRLLAVGLSGLLGILLLEVATTFGIRMIRSRITTELNRELVLSYYGKILNLAVEDFIAFRQRTNLFQRVMDAMSITPQFTDVLVRGGQCIVVVLVVGTAVGMVSPLVLGVLVAGSAVLFAYVLVQSDRIRVLRQRTLALNFPLVGKMMEIIGGLFTIKALAASVRVTSDIQALVSGKTDAEYAEYAAEVRMSQVADAIRSLTMVYAIAASIVQLWNGSLQVADVFALYMLTNLFLTPVSELAARYQSLSRLSVNVGNFYEVLDLQDEADEARAAAGRHVATALLATVPRAAAVSVARPVLVGAGSGGGRRAGPAFASGPPIGEPAPGVGAVLTVEPRRRGHIVLRDVEFAYRGSDPVIRGLSLEVFPGERISLIGKSGVGKTTLFRLLLGFLQAQRGNVVVDGAEVGSLIDKNAYRRRFGVVSQHDVMFGVSMRENMMFGLEDGVPEERIEEALRMVNLWDDVQRVGGLDTQYGADLFSGGQMQRFFIARALLRQPSVVLLDEPTSALDFQSEALVMDAVGRLVGGKTTLTIAHRLSTVRDADRVVVLEAGTVRAVGTHDELYERDDYYRALCNYNSFMV
jgi:ABC-type multidrug transport system fused ATPase/permease subunit